jgi:hypothetical protein
VNFLPFVWRLSGRGTDSDNNCKPAQSLGACADQIVRVAIGSRVCDPDPVDPIILAPVVTALIAGLSGAVAEWYKRTFRRNEEKERKRLRAEVLGPSAGEYEAVKAVLAKRLAEYDSVAKAVAEAPGDDARESAAEAAGDSTRESVAEAARAAFESEITSEVSTLATQVAPKDRHARFAVLLVDYYAYGLTQARMSFAVSLACSLLGGLVLIAGVALAIFNATTSGHLYAGVVTSVAGVLTTSIGVLFHQQANRALKHMEEQTNKLRQDMKAEQDSAVAVELLDEVADEELKARLQAALILRFSGAKLPDINRSKSTTSPKSKLLTSASSELNGQRPTAKRHGEAPHATPSG